MLLVMEQDIIVFVMVLVARALLTPPEEMRVAPYIKTMGKLQDKRHIKQLIHLVGELKLKKEQFITGKQLT